MADYYSPATVQPIIPIGDMTALELLLLTLVFNAERDGDALYFFTEYGPSDIVTLSRAQLVEAWEVSQWAIGSTANVYIAEKLANAPLPDPSEPDDDVDIDMTGTSWELLFQDIAKRSATVDEIVVTTSFTCSKMRLDGFGGSVVLITANAISGKSTTDILEDLRADLDRPKAPRS